MLDAHRNRRIGSTLEYTTLKQRLDGCAASIAAILRDAQGNGIDQARLQECEKEFSRLCDGRREVLWFALFHPASVLRVSQSFEALWGCSVGRLMQNPRVWVNTIHPDDRQRVENTFTSWLEQGATGGYSIAYRIVRSDGSVIGVYDSVSGIFDKDAKLVGTCGIVRVLRKDERTESRVGTTKQSKAHVQALRGTWEVVR